VDNRGPPLFAVDRREFEVDLLTVGQSVAVGVCLSGRRAEGPTVCDREPPGLFFEMVGKAVPVGVSPVCRRSDQLCLEIDALIMIRDFFDRVA